MAKWICEKSKECTDENCADRKPHNHDEWCERGCDSVNGKFPEAKCIMLNPSGVELIAQERQRQIEKEGWNEQHDDEHVPFSMSTAGAIYALDLQKNRLITEKFGLKTANLINDMSDILWPWDDKWWKPSKDPIRNLAKAGALIAAEIDRLQRQGKG